MTEEELLNYEGLEAVTVEPTNADLIPTASRCLAHGLPMHLDKPPCEDLGQFKTFLDGCREKSVPIQMGYMFRGNPAMELCKKMVREGWLGDIFEIQASMSHNYGTPAYQPYLGSFKGGIMYNLVCHLIDFVVAMMGRPENVTPYLKSVGDGTAKNNGLAILEYPHGTAALRSCCFELDGTGRRRYLKICGTKGLIELCPLERFDRRPLEMKLTLSEGNEYYPAGTHTLGFGVQRDRYESQLRELAKIIRGDMENPYTYEHDYLTHEVLLAASGCTQWK
jgi:predicted dehydrogenase